MKKSRLIMAAAIAGALTVGGAAAMADTPVVADAAPSTTVATPIAASQQLHIQDPDLTLVEQLQTRQQIGFRAQGVTAAATATQTRLQIQDPAACDCDGDGLGYGNATGDCDGTGPDDAVRPMDGTGYQHGIGSDAAGPGGAHGRS